MIYGFQMHFYKYTCKNCSWYSFRRIIKLMVAVKANAWALQVSMLDRVDEVEQGKFIISAAYASGI